MGSVQTDISRILQTDVGRRETEGISSDRKHFKTDTERRDISYILDKAYFTTQVTLIFEQE